MNIFEWFSFNHPDTWIKVWQEHYSRLHNNIKSTLREVHKMVIFYIYPEDRAMADWEPEIWFPKIMDHDTQKHRQDLHIIDSRGNCISDNDHIK